MLAFSPTVNATKKALGYFKPSASTPSITPSFSGVQQIFFISFCILTVYNHPQSLHN